jgi:hypothetical protein
MPKAKTNQSFSHLPIDTVVSLETLTQQESLMILSLLMTMSSFQEWIQ